MPDWITNFPFQIQINLNAIDESIRAFALRFSGFFDTIKGLLNAMVSGVTFILNLMPWWLTLILIFLGSWKVTKRISRGIIYSLMMSFIGFVGLWDKMNETLAIVICSVIISLLIGFPIGILVASSERANKITRPILDTMQTMPVFVYLIPAILFFGLGKAPAVIATTIYAVVPTIRLTAHGIRQVDFEIVEAAKAFGSTKMQMLTKVQIPQALPTIMTGVNQTLMMAMAMVVTCSMIGATGLGMEVLLSVNRIEMGRGLIAGTAVVILAVILDRLTQGAIVKQEGDKHE